MLEGEYVPSPWPPIAEQVLAYERSGGEEGGLLEGAPCVILTTVGARSGSLRRTPLIRIEKDGSYAVVASAGGMPQDPAWSRNLRVHPDCELQDGPVVRAMRAREVQGSERDQWWAAATAVWPAYDTYQASTERVIPVFVLEGE